MVNNKLIDELTNQYSIEVKDLVKWFLDEFRDEIETITDEEFAKVIKGISCLCDKRRNIDDIKTHLKRKFEHTKAAYIIKALENYKYYIPRTINDFLDGYVPTTIFAGGKIKVRSLFLTCFKVIINCFSSQGRFRNILTYYAAKHPKRKAVSERNYRSRNIKEKRKCNNGDDECKCAY